MKIRSYMKEHEQTIRSLLTSSENPEELKHLKQKHARVIAFMQHERLVHLIVTLAFGLFTLLAVVMAFIWPNPKTIILSGLLLILTTAYLLHYFYMENTIQRWYELMDTIEGKIQSS